MSSPDGVASWRMRSVRLLVVALVTAVVGGATGAGVASAQASTPVRTGVVVIDTHTADGSAAGTGMVLTSGGEILTNNHVIEAASSIRIVIPATGRRYTATVVGYDVTHDVAVLRAKGASNLKTVTVGDSSSVKRGQTVSAVGNAGGTGSLSTSTGRVTALSQSITVSDDTGAGSRLTRLLRTDAELQPGDSGGPLLNAAHKVIGMDTAAMVGGRGPWAVARSEGYAIPIDRAIAIVKKIDAGTSSSTIHLGGTAYLGVEVTDRGQGTGAAVAAVVPGGPAAGAGLSAGDVITGIAGHPVSSASKLGALVLRQKVGAQVTVTYTDQAGQSRSATVTLGSGPPQ